MKCYKDLEDFLVYRALRTHENKEYLNIEQFMKLIEFIDYLVVKIK
jgi:hypothetical protein